MAISFGMPSNVRELGKTAIIAHKDCVPKVIAGDRDDNFLDYVSVRFVLILAVNMSMLCCYSSDVKHV